MIKLIACDLDQTLIPNDHIIKAPNIEAVKKCTAAGIKFVLATGRGFNTVQGTLKDLGLYDLENEYVMSYNGGAITENKGNKIVHFEGLPFEKASELYKCGLNYDVCTHVYTTDKVYCYNFFEDEKRWLKGFQEMTEIFTDNIDFLKDTPICKVLYTNTNREYLQSIEKELQPILGDCDTSYSANRYIEFNKKGVNKGEGLRILAKMLNIDISETMAIGDNLNDLPMIEAAGLGVGVANTVADMKPKCDVITENDCEHDGVAEAIYKYVLI